MGKCTLHISAIYGKNYCIFVYLIINALKWPSKISKLCYVVFSRRKKKQKIPNFGYYYVFTYFGHILQKLLYFRIFNNKYIEMAFKDIKIMLCHILKKKKKAKSQ